MSARAARRSKIRRIRLADTIRSWLKRGGVAPEYRIQKIETWRMVEAWLLSLGPIEGAAVDEIAPFGEADLIAVKETLDRIEQEREAANETRLA